VEKNSNRVKKIALLVQVWEYHNSDKNCQVILIKISDIKYTSVLLGVNVHHILIGITNATLAKMTNNKILCRRYHFLKVIRKVKII
jgi:hypothetical protein